MKSKRCRSRSHSKDGDNVRSPMPKRRKPSASKDENKNEPLSTTCSTQKQPQGEVVRHISQFLSHTSEEEDAGAVVLLVRYLEAAETSTTDSSDTVITNEDIATLLLPWSVARLMRIISENSALASSRGDTEIIWRTLSCCLDTLSPSNNSLEAYETALSTSLSQSTLSKLVRAAASSTFLAEPLEQKSTEVQEYASNCFLKLVRRSRPSFEVVCNTLLKQVEDLVYSPDQIDDYENCVEKCLPRHQYEVVCSSLETVHNLLAGANVKRSFAILSSEEMLPRLGRLGFLKCADLNVDTNIDGDRRGKTKELVEKIINDGLFHRTHHIEGFRTMEQLRGLPSLPQNNVVRNTMESESVANKSKKDGKGCYQSGLFKSLRVLLSDAELKDTVATANMLPLIIRGFFDQIQCKQRRDFVNGVKSSTEADAKIQFYFWAHASISSFEHLHQSEANIALLQMTSQTLQIILENDAYSPSYSDPDETLASFLKYVTREVLGCIHMEHTTMPKSYTQRSIFLLASIRTLLLLNHRLLHEQLSSCIAFACQNLHQRNDKEMVYLHASAVLSTIAKTYGELRQIGHFLSSSRSSFVHMKRSQYDCSSMHSLLIHGDVMELLSTSYHMLPSGQLNEIWDFFDEWIVLNSGEVSSMSTELTFAICMFIHYIKNIRADKHNSAELRLLCEKTMISSVEKLLDQSKLAIDKSNASVNVFIKQGIDLCGWLVDLHTRSCFWIDAITIDGDGSAFLLSRNNDGKNTLNVLSYLWDVATKTVESERLQLCENTRGVNQRNYLDTQSLSLRSSCCRLALHRIQQLHSMIYYCKVLEHEQSSENKGKFSSAELTNEAKLLVCFVISTAQKSSASFFEPESMWSTIAQSIGTWCHYAELVHTKEFLRWFFHILSRIDDQAILQQDKDCVLALIRDASFYEVNVCTSLLLKEGLMYLIKNVTPCFGNSDIMNDHAVAASCLKIKSQMETTPLSNENTGRAIRSVFNVISFLSSAPLSLGILSIEENISLIDKVVALDILVSKACQSTAESSKSCIELFRTLHAARRLLASLIPSTIIVSSNDSYESVLMLAVEHLIKSSILLNGSADVSRATGDALAEVFTICTDSPDKERGLAFKFAAEMALVTDVDNHSISASEFSIQVLLMRSVVRKMNTLNRHHSFSKRAYQIWIDMVLSCRRRMWSKLIYHIKERNTSPLNGKAAADSLLLASELLTFLRNADLMSNPSPGLITKEVRATTTENIKEIFDLLRETYMNDPDNSLCFNEASNYFLSCMVSTQNISECIPTATLIRTILTAVKKSDSPLLESALFSIMRESSTVDDTKLVVLSLPPKDETCRSSQVFHVKVYNLLLHCVKSEEQIRYLSSHSMKILMASMSLLQISKTEDNAAVVHMELFSRIMSNLIPRKDILLLSGRELAMICCGMSSLFDNKQQLINENMLAEVTTFKSCCSVVSSLIANYTKQLYGCPNGLFSLLLAMLEYILQSDSKRGLNAHALEYAKLCELLIPHKEFKKHSVGLILRFIHSLNDGMASTTKSKLIPSIHGLLDMCSEYETRQINAMIDAPSKALFAPVFQSYQKYYQYHGI